MKNIYNLDTSKKISAKNVRDAIVECFFQAHCLDTGLDEEEFKNRLTKNYCKIIVEKAFQEIGGDFDHPTKTAMFKVINHLAEFSKAFRDPEIIHKHKKEIEYLLNLLD